MSADPGRSRKIALSLSSGHSAGPLSYLELGRKDRPCVVFVHGFGANLLTWQLCLVPLASAFRVVALDLPGHGQSTREVGAGDLDFMTGWLAEAFDLLGIDRAHMIGHSMGAKIVIAFSARHRDRVSSLALISPAGMGAAFHIEPIERLLAEAGRERAEAAARHLLGPRSGNLIHPLAESLHEAAADPGRNAAMRKLLDHSLRHGAGTLPVGFDWGDLPYPVKILWGDRDRLIPMPLPDRLPPAPLALIAHTGHLPHMEAPGDVVSALRSFLG